MKILHVSYIETNSGWGAECFLDSALERLGHTVYKVDFKKHFNDLTTEIQKYEDFDLFFLQRGDWFPKEILKSVNRPCVFWASELISRCRDQDRLLYSGLFDHIFVHSTSCLETLSRKLRNRKDNTKLSCLINAYDSDLHRKLYLSKDIDVLFIGSITERRRNILNDLKNRIQITICENVYAEQFVELVNRAKIVINIHSAKHLDTETRVFEVLGCGTFLLSEKLSKENPFIPGMHYVEADIDEFEEVIKKYLADESAREKIAAAGYMEALNNHSYLARARDSIVPIFERCIVEYGMHDQEALDMVRMKRLYSKESSFFYKAIRRLFIRCFEKYQHIYDRINVK